MSQLETENLPIDEWDISSENDELEFETLEDLLNDQDLQTLTNSLIGV
ncbi:hypothetical protein ACSYAD_31515 [Acaryochloris marina NIES-2412]